MDTSDKEAGEGTSRDGANDKVDIKFFPSMGVQRYGFVADIVASHFYETLLDIGAGESVRLLHWLKQINSLRRYYAVDIDEKGLLASAPTSPKSVDILNRIRYCELKVDIFCGSIFDVESTNFVVDCIILIEVIEHVDDVELLTRNIFGKFQSKMIIITTPNRDFNRFFPGVKLRHPDHRFEWTRKEFKSYTERVSKHFNYNVEIGGLGTLPDCNSDDYGFCTQYAIFRKNECINMTDQYASCSLELPRKWRKLFSFSLPAISRYHQFTSALLAKMSNKDRNEWFPIKELNKRGLLADLGPISLLFLLALQSNFQISSNLLYIKYRNCR
ncbi:hypothetical protein GJ496_006012 [Pomphorhynchus laevis]|nr:hypothetical protein GJ496_006012 [Pomphorhynchus laevis]